MNHAARIGFWLGLALFAWILWLPAPASMERVARGDALPAASAAAPAETLSDAQIPARVQSMKATAAITALIATWWIFASLPLAATSLVPLVAFPVLGVMSGRAVAACYGHHLIFLFLGGFILARGVERWNLHRRIALWIVSAVGTQRRRLVLGFMLASAGLSMWISNTATTMMMLAIGLAVVRTLPGTDEQIRRRFASALLLGIGYAASIGGIATPIGTPPNVSFALNYASQFPDAAPISFGGWMVAFLPLTLLMLPIAWWLLTRVVSPIPHDPQPLGRDEIARQRAALGRLQGAELRMLFVFAATALLWMTRTVPLGDSNLGWSHLLASGLASAGIAFEAKTISDTTIAIAMALLLFVLPGDRDESGASQKLMNWETAEGLPWGVLLLFGGGYAIAEAFAQSGLSVWFAYLFAGLPLQHPVALIGGTCTLMTFLTEVTSNTATTNIMLPVIGQLSLALGVPPLPMMLAATISASCAFMLPVATPPNAIVFGSGQIRMRDMLLGGFLLNLVGIVLITALLLLFVAPLLRG